MNQYTIVDTSSFCVVVCQENSNDHIRFFLFFFLHLQLLEMLKFYARFEINEESGDPLTDHDMTQLHYTKITSLQV